MRLRSGNKYTSVVFKNSKKPKKAKKTINEIDIAKIVYLQSICRYFIVKNRYSSILNAIKTLRTSAPHLYKYKPKKKKSKKKKIEKIEDYSDEINEIISQYNTVKDMGRSIKNGVIRSKRKNKGKNPDRYIDPNFKEIFMEDNTVEDFLGSSDDELYEDSLGEDNIVYSCEEDGEWDVDDFSENDDY